MVLATSNPAKQLLCVSYIEKVQADDLKRSREDLKVLLANLSPGFRLLVDLTRLESMGRECAPEIGQLMDLIDQGGVSLVVRVIPDPKKDIGMNILTIFHYRHRPRLVTCENLTDAASELAL
ncbi:MAG: hypothetical protein U1F83_04625 [Verrucomicrobiota bacterium]